MWKKRWEKKRKVFCSKIYGISISNNFQIVYEMLQKIHLIISPNNKTKKSFLFFTFAKKKTYFKKKIVSVYLKKKRKPIYFYHTLTHCFFLHLFFCFFYIFYFLLNLIQLRILLLTATLYPNLKKQSRLNIFFF